MPGRSTMFRLCYVGLYRPSFLDSSRNGSFRCAPDFRCYVSTETCLLCTSKRLATEIRASSFLDILSPNKSRYTCRHYDTLNAQARSMHSKDDTYDHN